MTEQIELPRYRSHKTVWALKIKSIIQVTDDDAMIYPEEHGYDPVRVDGAYMGKHEPKVGGYYVVYSDGYKSWSPADAFEEGYTRE